MHLAGSAKGDEDKTRNLVRGPSGRGSRIWCTSRSSAPNGSRSTAESTAPCSATSRPSGPRRRWSRLRTAVDDAARHPVPRADADGGAADGEAAGGTLPAGVPVPPVEADEVAARLVELTLGEAAGLVPDMGGPRVYSAARAAARLPSGEHRRRLIVPVRLPGKAAREFRAARPWLPSRPWDTGPGRSSLPRSSVSAVPSHALAHLRPQSKRVAPNLFRSPLKSWVLGSALTPGGLYNDSGLGTRALEDALR